MTDTPVVQETETEEKPDLFEETADPVRRLLKKQMEWLLQQPEYPLVFLADRHLRRQASRELAKAFMTLPHRRFG